MATTTPPSWASIIITALCRGLLVMVASMALWAALPAALGWHITVVMSGSMEPALRTGDIVASRPISGAAVRPGQVLLVDDPDHQGRLRLHRLAKVVDGKLVLRGDANRAEDSTPVSRNAVHGVGSLRVPFIGAPAYWLRTHQFGPLIPTGLATALIVIGAIGRRHWPDDDDDSTEDGAESSTTDAADTSDETDSASAKPVLVESRAQLRALRTEAARRDRRRRKTLVILTTVALTGAAVATKAPAHAASAFTGKTTNTSSSWTADYFSCSAAVLDDKPYLYYPFSEKSGSTAGDASGHGHNGTYEKSLLFGGITYGEAGPCASDSVTGVTLDGTFGMISTADKITGPQEYTQEIWFKTTSKLGGSLIGFASSSSGLALNYDRHLYMTASGQLVTGVHPGTANQTIRSTAGYNDGTWHLASVTLSPSTGLTMYVDGTEVATDGDLKGAQDYSGYWRFGDTPLTGWPNAPLGSHFSGSVQGAAIFHSALSAAQIANHYAGH